MTHPLQEAIEAALDHLGYDGFGNTDRREVVTRLCDEAEKALADIESCRKTANELAVRVAKAEAERDRLRAFHGAWIEMEVALATGDADLCIAKRKALVATHQQLVAMETITISRLEFAATEAPPRQGRADNRGAEEGARLRTVA